MRNWQKPGLISKWALIMVGSLAICQAQPEFEVASVKPAANPEGRALIQALPGRLTMTNLALRRLILIAYGLQDYQLAGDPAGIDSEHYDIQAKAGGTATVQQIEGPMLRELLEARFQLVLHRETRQLPVYELRMSKRGAKPEPAKEGSCIPYVVDSPPPAATPAGESRPNYCGVHGTVDGLNRTLEGKAVSMAELAATLSRSYNSVLGRNVIDATGLTGMYDVNLRWAIDPLSSGVPPAKAPVLPFFVAVRGFQSA